MYTREELVQEAFEKLGIPGDGDELSMEQLKKGIRALQPMIDLFAAKQGLPLWLTRTYTFSMDNLANGGANLSESTAFATDGIPTRILNVWRKDISNNQVIPMNFYDRQKFLDLPNPTQTGTPTHYTYTPRAKALSFSCWPLPDAYWNTYGSLIMTVTELADKLNNDDAELNFPDYWTEAIIYGLATRLAPGYGVDPGTYSMIDRVAKESLKEAEDASQQEGSIFIIPRTRL